MNTEEKIRTKALELFNREGIEYVGMRELAATLNIRVSNITYYFPTKDDLVNRLSLDLNQLNSKILLAENADTPENFIGMIRQVFHHHQQYRCLMISFVHLMEQNRKIASRYRKTQKDRNAMLRSSLISLAGHGYLQFREPEDLELITSVLALIARFWISEAAISISALDPEAQMNHYLAMVVGLLIPYSTAQGKIQWKKIISGLKSEASP